MKKIVLFIYRLFHRNLRHRTLYAIRGGELVGSFFAYIKEEDIGTNRALLLMPMPMKALYVDDKELKYDLKIGEIEPVNKLPQEVYEVCRANFIHFAKAEGIYASR